jgi:hypothetical protein
MAVMVVKWQRISLCSKDKKPRDTAGLSFHLNV